MERISFILKRHCSRDFSKGKIPEKDINVLIEAGRHAPSAGNMQPCYYYLVTNQEKKEELVKAAYGQNFIIDAYISIVVCVDPDQSASRYGSRGSELYCLQDSGAAVQNILLAATVLGYGSCWVGAFDEKQASRALNIPSNLRPVAIIPIGPGKVPSRGPARKAVNEITRWIK